MIAAGVAGSWLPGNGKYRRIRLVTKQLYQRRKYQIFSMELIFERWNAMRLSQLDREEQLSLIRALLEEKASFASFFFLRYCIASFLSVVSYLHIQIDTRIFLHLPPHLLKSVQAVSIDAPLLTLSHIRWLQDELSSLRRSRLSPNDHTPGLRAQKFQNSLGSGKLRLAIPDVQKHDDVDDVPGTSSLSEKPVGSIIEKIRSDVAILESVPITEKLMANSFVLFEQIRSKEAFLGSTVCIEFPKILAKASS